MCCSVLQEVAAELASAQGHQKGNLARRYEAGPSRDSSEGRSMHDTPLAAKPYMQLTETGRVGALIA